MYRLFIRPLLFLFAPETSHHLALKALSLCLKIPLLSQVMRSTFSYSGTHEQKTLWGITFPNVVGLAAGFDKDGKYIKGLDALGFGFIEVGTVTPLPQDGNPNPRLFRLKQDRGLINRMGFNNEGVDALVNRLKSLDRDKISAVIGGNIGKNKVTPNEEAHLDYLKCFEALHPYVDYFVVNVSSPNTPGLRALQDRDSLELILTTLLDTETHRHSAKPILLKISPDLTQAAITDIVDLVNSLQIDGIITSNTTISRDKLKTASTQIDKIGNGGLSGAPVREKADQMLTWVNAELQSDKAIIAVGGIETAEHALAKLQNGADLIQVYTGFIYEGPLMVKKIRKGLEAAHTSIA